MTTTTTLKNALDGARAVGFDESGRTFVVWHGGTTFNVYTWGRNNPALVREVDVFTVSDEKGRPVDHDDAVVHIEEYHDRET